MKMLQNLHNKEQSRKAAYQKELKKKNEHFDHFTCKVKKESPWLFIFVWPFALLITQKTEQKEAAEQDPCFMAK